MTTPAELSSLPPLPAGAVPADVRAAGPEAEQTYRTALAFEHVLLGEVAKALQSTAKADGETSASTSAYMEMIPNALSDSLVAGGGIGLASDLARALGKERP